MSKIMVEVSARHCHLTKEHVEKLFGKGYQLKILKMVSQPGQWASKEEIKIKGPKGELKLRIVGPARSATQVELSVTECYRLGIKPVLRVSGDIKSTPGAFLIGPKGRIKINQGVIVAQRHVHLSPSELKSLKLKKGKLVSVKIKGPRGLVFNNVIVRSGEGHKKSFQIDTDEGNACGWAPGMKGDLIK
ncbi:MAG TPA: phosphate propanoyltransferase [Candidatus Uhrbacteria bacterium]|nr:phosphate propanoyltransferase [Candidatus Uhrbacteria bacterium]